MLRIGFYLLGLVGAIVAVIPLIFIIGNRNIWYIFAFIPSLLIAKIFYMLSGLCKVKEAQRITGMSIEELRVLYPNGFSIRTLKNKIY